jgi:hypothetical protein
MQRQGKTIGTDTQKLQRRRLADGRNAWRKMTAEQRGEFRAWIADQGLAEVGLVDRKCSRCGETIRWERQPTPRCSPECITRPMGVVSPGRMGDPATRRQA